MGNEGSYLQTILIAEDSDDLRAMLKQLLEANQYRVLEAGDGREAIEAALRERPNLILMDLGLPGTDGLSAVAEIREHIPVAEMPILIISAYDRLEYRTEAISAGCSGYLTKPVDPAMLLKTIDLLLRKDEKGLSTSRSGDPARLPTVFRSTALGRDRSRFRPHAIDRHPGGHRVVARHPETGVVCRRTPACRTGGRSSRCAAAAVVAR